MIRWTLWSWWWRWRNISVLIFPMRRHKKSRPFKLPLTPSTDTLMLKLPTKSWKTTPMKSSDLSIVSPYHASSPNTQNSLLFAFFLMPVSMGLASNIVIISYFRKYAATVRRPGRHRYPRLHPHQEVLLSTGDFQDYSLFLTRVYRASRRI